MSDSESTMMQTIRTWPSSRRKIDLGNGVRTSEQFFLPQLGTCSDKREHSFIGGVLPGSAFQKQRCLNSGLKVESELFWRKSGKDFLGERSGMKEGMAGETQMAQYMESSPLWSELTWGGDTEQTRRPPVTYINIVTVHTHDCLCFPPKFLLVMGIAKKCHIIFEWTFLNGDIVFLMEYQQKSPTTTKPFCFT